MSRASSRRNFSGVSICRARISWNRSSGAPSSREQMTAERSSYLALDRPARRELKERSDVREVPGRQLEVGGLHGSERVRLGRTVVGSDRHARAFGDVRKPGIGRDARDPSICPSRDGGAEADLRGDVEKQILERAPCRDGFAVRRPLGGDVRCQHAAKRRLVADKRVDPEPRDRADELTEKLDVAAEARVRRIRRADEEMGEPGALDDEELRVQMREEGRARPLPASSPERLAAGSSS